MQKTCNLLCLFFFAFFFSFSKTKKQKERETSRDRVANCFLTLQMVTIFSIWVLLTLGTGIAMPCGRNPMTLASISTSKICSNRKQESGARSWCWTQKTTGREYSFTDHGVIFHSNFVFSKYDSNQLEMVFPSSHLHLLWPILSNFTSVVYSDFWNLRILKTKSMYNP